MRRLPRVPPDLVRSAYAATGLEPCTMTYRSGTHACPLAALLACLGGVEQGEQDPIQRWAPKELVPWWRGFLDGCDFPVETQVHGPLSTDGLYRLGRAAGGAVRSDILDSAPEPT